MRSLPFSPQLHRERWEVAASTLEHLDPYCSSPYWGLPLVEAFHRRGRLVVYDNGLGMAIFHEIDVEGGRLILPCDTMWGLGTSIFSPGSKDFLLELAQGWLRESGPLRQATVAGPFLSSPLWKSEVWQLFPAWGQSDSARQIASLDGGVEGYLSRRSANFRSRLRRAIKKSMANGVVVEFWPHNASQERTLELFERAMQVEAKSWKGIAGYGVDRGQMCEFYGHMLPMLAERGYLRGLFLCREGKDLSYLFGASFAGGFRGLQFSFDDAEHQSLGNVAQWYMIEALCQEGCKFYDLGQAMPYKVRWAEQKVLSQTRSFQISG